MDDAEEMLAVMIKDGAVSPNFAKDILSLITETRIIERKRCAEAVHRTAKDFYGNTDQMYAAALIVSAIEAGQ